LSVFFFIELAIQDTRLSMKAMILAAGRGERMRPLTDHLPKPLLEVKGRPMIEWTVAALAAAGIRELVINHAHLGGLIEQSLGDGACLGVHIAYSPEGSALETAGGIVQALPLLGDQAFIAVNGDLYCDYDFSGLTRRTLGADLAHLVMVANPPHHPAGDFCLTAGRLATSGPAAGRHTFAGIGLYSSALFDGLERGLKAPLAPLLRSAMDRGQVSGELHAGPWHAVGTPERLAALNTGG
jgi:MurNAc alpha-1-phosphate uridylyltransferase